MIIIEGEWKSQMNENLYGKLSITINVDHFNHYMIGTVKLIHSNEHQCVNNLLEFEVEITYERQSELIFDQEKTIIDRLFIRQKEFGSDIYYTMQITSFDGNLWQGSTQAFIPMI